MKEDAGKFLEANNKIFMAKSYIEECKNVINNLDFDVPESSDFQIAKEKIIDCDIAKVATQIDEILMTLIAADGEFANEYLALLQEQREKYADSNIVFWKETSEREFLAMYAAMLAEADARGALSEEGKQQLALIRKQMDIYHVQDELNSTKMASEEYKNLTNEYFNNYAELIRMQPNLTDEEKREMLRNLRDQRTYQLNKIDINIEITDNAEKLEGMDPDSEQYYRTQENIFKLQQDATDLDIEWYNKIYESAVASGDYVTQERCANIISDLRAQNRQLQDKIDLNSMYIQKINLDKEYNEANAEDAYLIDAQRRQLDLDILQQKKDMGIATDAEKEYLEMSPLGRAWENTKAFTISTFLSVGRAGESIMDSVAMLGGNAEFVKTSIVDDAYSGLVAAGVINEVAAYGDAYEIGNTIGTMGGYVALSLLPGGPLVTTTVGALAAAGSAEQMALQRGATYEEALGTGAVAFALGGLSGYGLGALNAAAVGTTTAGQVALHTLAGGGIAALEPLGNSVAEYLIYGHDMMGEDASWWDYFKETGGPTNVLMAFGIGGISSGVTSLKAQKANVETGEKLITDFDNLSEAERSAAWEQYYGRQGGTHESGIGIKGRNGSHVDPNADSLNDHAFRRSLANLSEAERSSVLEQYYGRQGGTHESGIGIEGRNGSHGSYVDPKEFWVNRLKESMTPAERKNLIRELDDQYFKRIKVDDSFTEADYAIRKLIVSEQPQDVFNMLTIDEQMRIAVRNGWVTPLQSAELKKLMGTYKSVDLGQYVFFRNPEIAEDILANVAGHNKLLRVTRNALGSTALNMSDAELADLLISGGLNSTDLEKVYNALQKDPFFGKAFTTQKDLSFDVFQRHQSVIFDPFHSYFDSDGLIQFRYAPHDGAQTFLGFTTDKEFVLSAKTIDAMKKQGATLYTIDDLEGKMIVRNYGSGRDRGSWFGMIHDDKLPDPHKLGIVPHKQEGEAGIYRIFEIKNEKYQPSYKGDQMYIMQNGIESHVVSDKRPYIDVSPDGDYQVFMLEQEIRPWLDSNVTEKQYLFYLADKDGNIVYMKSPSGEYSMYHLGIEDLNSLGIIDKGTMIKLMPGFSLNYSANGP